MTTIKQIDPFCWEIPKSGAMRVPGRIFTDRQLIESDEKDAVCQQVVNVASLPGIVAPALAMPDIHWGYGFPIGGVAAFDWQTGIVSPGGVGYDINCGVRLARTQLTQNCIADKLDRLVTQLFNQIPSGLGRSGSVRLTRTEAKKVLRDGARWAVTNGFGVAEDLIHTEDEGCMTGANPKIVSERALTRGLKQLGTLGSGNHFLEIGLVDQIFDETVANVLGLFKGQVTLLLHSGSRGLGYQICDDFLAYMTKHIGSLDIQLPERQLACAWIQSEVGQRYLSAMACAANYAWANRQILLHLARQVFQRELQISPRDLAMDLVYDISHNIAKKETHMVDGVAQKLCVHRKGATRSFPAGHSALCEDYRAIGQPILVPGDMGTASYVLVGAPQAMVKSFGSTCHGAGRVLSRKAAKKKSRGRVLHQELAARGVLVRWSGRHTLAEEMPEAYKDVSQVVNVVQNAGLSSRVARLRPIAVVKG